MAIMNMMDIDLKGKRVLIRQDLNVPMKDGCITSSKRIVEALPTIRAALDAGARVMIMSHLGRPKAGAYDPAFSLAPVAEALSKELGMPVPLVKEYIGVPVELAAGACVLFENVRFLEGEKKDDSELGRAMASLCDVYVMDAFGTAHRAHASTHAVAQFAPVACAGLLLSAELDALAKGLTEPAKPLVAIIGGSKVSTKLTVLKTLSEQVDKLIVGGGIANNFIKAAGYNVGRSLYEPDLVDEAKALMDAAKANGGAIPVPTDVVVAKALTDDAVATIKSVDQVEDDDMILDVGPATSALYTAILSEAGTIVWNGPVGAFEWKQFSAGTEALCHAVANSSAFSIAGGGDTVAAVEKYNVVSKVNYISTGGGAFLEFLEGKTLPAVSILNK